MLHPDPVLHQQIPVIRKIIEDETWLEGERRGCSVQADDRVVRERVCEILLRVGAQLRAAAMAALNSGGNNAPPSELPRE